MSAVEEYKRYRTHFSDDFIFKNKADAAIAELEARLLDTAELYERANRKAEAALERLVEWMVTQHDYDEDNVRAFARHDEKVKP
jgi:hypothetical protein